MIRCLFAATLFVPSAASVFPLYAQSIFATTNAMQVIGAEATAGGGLLLADYDRPAIFKLNEKGEVVWLVAAKGVGPGDVLRPYRIAATPSGGVLVYDQAARDFSEFTSEGKFVRRFRLEINFTVLGSLAVTRDQVVVVAGFSRDTRARDGSVHVFSPSGRHLRSFAPLPVVSDRALLAHVGAGFVDVDQRGRILHTRLGPYEIGVYDVSGRLLERLEAPVSIGAYGDDLVTITTTASGSESIRTRHAEITFPLRSRWIDESTIFAAWSDRGELRFSVRRGSAPWTAPAGTQRLPSAIDRLRGRSYYVEPSFDGTRIVFESTEGLVHGGSPNIRRP